MMSNDGPRRRPPHVSTRENEHRHGIPQTQDGLHHQVEARSSASPQGNRETINVNQGRSVNDVSNTEWYPQPPFTEKGNPCSTESSAVPAGPIVDTRSVKKTWSILRLSLIAVAILVVAGVMLFCFAKPDYLYTRFCGNSLEPCQVPQNAWTKLRKYFEWPGCGFANKEWTTPLVNALETDDVGRAFVTVLSGSKDRTMLIAHMIAASMFDAIDFESPNVLYMETNDSAFTQRITQQLSRCPRSLFVLDMDTLQLGSAELALLNSVLDDTDAMAQVTIDHKLVAPSSAGATFILLTKDIDESMPTWPRRVQQRIRHHFRV